MAKNWWHDSQANAMMIECYLIRYLEKLDISDVGKACEAISREIISESPISGKYKKLLLLLNKKNSVKEALLLNTKISKEIEKMASIGNKK